MPFNAPVSFQTGQLPGGEAYCPSNWQALYEMMFSLTMATLPGNYTTYVTGSSRPGVSDEDKIWSNDTDGRNYRFLGGYWVSRHGMAPGVIMLYPGTQGSIPTFDGGDTNTPDDSNGPMWEEYTAAAGRIPVHPGTLQPSGTVVAVTDTGGVDQHTLVTAETPSHTHNSQNWSTFSGGTQWDPEAQGDNGGTLNPGAATTATGGGLPHTNMPPYIGLFLIRRTARLYYRA